MPAASRLEKAASDYVTILQAQEEARVERDTRRTVELGQTVELFDVIHSQNEKIGPYGESIEIPIRADALGGMPEQLAGFLTVLLRGKETRSPQFILKTMTGVDGQRELTLDVIFDFSTSLRHGEISVNIEPFHHRVEVEAEAYNTVDIGDGGKRESEKVFDQGMDPLQFPGAHEIDIHLAVAQELLLYVADQSANVLEQKVKDASNR